MHLSSTNPVIFEVNVGNKLHQCAFVQIKSELNIYDNSRLDMDILYGNHHTHTQLHKKQQAAQLNKIEKIENNSNNGGFVRIAPYQNTLIPVMVNNHKYHTCSLTVYVEDPTIGCIANELLFNRQNIEICTSEGTNKIMIKYVEDYSNVDSLLSSMLLPKYLINNMKNYGWNNPTLWNEITEDDLIQMGFKKGHIATFFDKYLDVMDPNNDILNCIKYILVKSWNFPIYILTNMIKYGWIDPCDWYLIQDIHFQKMNFKDGHIIKFKKGIKNNGHLLEINKFQKNCRYYCAC